MRRSPFSRHYGVWALMFLVLIMGCQTSKGPLDSDREQKPSIQITDPLNHAHVTGIVKLKFIIVAQNTDTSGIIELWVDNTYTGVKTRTTVDSLEWNTQSCKDGSEHTLSLKLYLDSLNTVSSEPVSVIINNLNPPDISELDTITYSNNSFHIHWTRNSSQDFKSYSLYESLTPALADSTVIYSSENINDTLFTVTGIAVDECRFYRLVVTDSSELKSISAIQAASTSAETGFVRYYFKIWKNLFLTRNQISEDYYNSHLEIISCTIRKWDSGISFYLSYIMHIDWADIEGDDNFLVLLNSSATEYQHLNIPRDVYLTEREITVILDNRVYGSSIGKVNPVENLLYTDYEQAVSAFQTAVNCDKIFPQRLAYYVPGKLPRIDGDPYFIGFGTLDSLNNRCIDGYFNLITGIGSAHETVCIIIN